MKFAKETKTTSFLSESIELNGNLDVRGGIRVDGTIIGSLKSESTIFIGETAIIEGDISTQSLISSGKISGRVHAEDTVKITHHGSIEGEIKTCTLGIDKDVYFNAKCQLLSPKNNHPPTTKQPRVPRKAIPERE